MIQRYSEVSDGKRYHAINRDPQGQWCKWDDVQAMRYFIVNEALRVGVTPDEINDAMPFNQLVRILELKIEQNAIEAASKPKADIVQRLEESCEFLINSGSKLPSYLCQEAADEIKFLREQRDQAEACYNRLLEDSGGIRSRSKGWG